MRIVITGGAGYIGSTAVGAFLAAGHEVTVFDSLIYGGDALRAFAPFPSFQLVKGDVRDLAHLARVAAVHDAIVHLAAIVGEPACSLNEEAARAINLDGSANVLRVFEEARLARLIFLSTCSNYGVSDPGVMVDEDAPLRPLSLYARCKVESEQRVLNHKGRGCTTVLRFGTICGVSARMRFDLLVNDMARAAALGESISVYSPDAWRPNLHVRDAAGALAAVLDAAPAQVDRKVYNVVGDNCTKRMLLELVNKHFPATEIVINEGKTDPRDYRADGARLTREIGFRPALTVEDSLLEVATAVKAGVFVDPLWAGHSAIPLDKQALRPWQGEGQSRSAGGLSAREP